MHVHGAWIRACTCVCACVHTCSACGVHDITDEYNTPFTLQTEAKRSEPKRSEANRTAESAPFTLAQNAQQCAFHNSLLSTLHTVECASFHTGSEAKRSAHYLQVTAIFIIFGLNRVVSLSGTTTS